ncbi:MAG: pseudouridine-5'-phosphate glycosidase [Clostridia bacterium]|nr:pseudouridine-5'-phosphate glycosidase [Clostridia bacterium]
MNYKVVLSPEVKEALETGKPVIALESTIISHGMPYPQNVKTAHACQRLARRYGAVPATCAILNGELHAGLTDEEIEYLGRTGRDVKKVSRRDIPVVMARGEDGATTVAATMFIAHLAGIKVFATGGIGGVHRGAEVTMDISADLNELGRTPVCVVCAGPKSVLDIGLTLEYLETQGVPVIAFRTDTVPAFYTRDSGFAAPCRADSVGELADMVNAMDGLNMNSGMVVVNPIPEKYEMDPDKIDKATIKAVAEAKKKHIEGRDVTPFLLARIAELTNNASLDSNIALVYNNVCLAAKVAAAMNGQAAEAE